MMTSVANDEYAIGYISLGSLNEMVKAAAIDGVEPAVETVKDGSYTVVRPFNIAVMEEKLTAVDQDFIRFIDVPIGTGIITLAPRLTPKDNHLNVWKCALKIFHCFPHARLLKLIQTRIVCHINWQHRLPHLF